MSKAIFLLAMYFTCTITTNGFCEDLYANDGTYLGNTNNKYDPNSIYNKYGTYGSRYSSESINNPYGAYGSKYSPTSPNNRFAEPARAVDWNANTYRNFGGNSHSY